jgi:hypothetical protein
MVQVVMAKDWAGLGFQVAARFLTMKRVVVSALGLREK